MLGSRPGLSDRRPFAPARKSRAKATGRKQEGAPAALTGLARDLGGLDVLTEGGGPSPFP